MMADQYDEYAVPWGCAKLALADAFRKAYSPFCAVCVKISRRLKGLPNEITHHELLDDIDLCISNRHFSHKKEGRSEPVMNERMRSGRLVTFLVIRHRLAMRSSRVSGWPLASCALKWAQTNSSGLSSGA